MRAVPFFLRLQTRLVAFVVCCATLPGIAIAFFAMDGISVAVTDASEARNRIVLDQIERTLVRDFDTVGQTLVDTARSRDIHSAIDIQHHGGVVPGTVRRDLEEKVKDSPLCDRILIVDKRLTSIIDPGDRPWPMATLRRLLEPDWEKHQLVRHSDFEIEQGRSRMLSGAPIRSRSDNRLLGYAVMFTSAKELFRSVANAARSVGDDTFAFVLDQKGRLLVHSRSVDRGTGQEPAEDDGVVRAALTHQHVSWGRADVAEIPHFYTTRDFLLEPGWTLGLATPVAQFLHPVTSGQKVLAITTAVTLVFVVLASLVFSSRLVRPITGLHKSVDSFIRGETTFVDVTSVDEVGLLCQAYNTLVEELMETRRAEPQRSRQDARVEAPETRS